MFADIDSEWLSLLDAPEVERIEQKVAQITPDDAALCPPKPKWFEFARLTPLKKIKVIIIGQDPYYTKGTAHGLAFSSLGDKKPPSLRNIYECLIESKLMEKSPNHSDLTEWATEGVLLLNTYLSTELGSAGKHAEAWRAYSNCLLQSICEYGIQNGKVFKFFLWGNHAKSLKDDIKGHLVYTWIHPSPLAQRCAPELKFIKCDHFLRASEVNWNIKNKERVSSLEVECAPDLFQAFTDGSSLDGLGGYAVLYVGGPLKGYVDSDRIEGATSVRAEACAIITALESAAETDGWTRLQIYTDSDFWKNMLEQYMPKWTLEKFQTMKNPDLTTKMWELWQAIERPKEIRFVPAHNKRGWRESESPYEKWCYKHNEAVDKLASEARASESESP